jgi:hypothetical protein
MNEMDKYLLVDFSLLQCVYILLICAGLTAACTRVEHWQHRRGDIIQCWFLVFFKEFFK